MFRFYVHYLHTYLVGLQDYNGSMEAYLTSYERFYELFKDMQLESVLGKYIDLTEHKLSEQLLASQQHVRLHLCKGAFFLCDYLNLFDNLIGSFNSQYSNKLLIYKLLKLFRNRIKI